MKFIKRTADILISFCALLLLSPIFLVVSLISLIKQGKPILIGQRRYGKNAKVFKVLKFRTMRNDAPTVASADIKKQYITKWGSVLRKTSIDELPQLINVLKGDMSLVGTRPPTLDEWEKYDLHHRVRMSIKPGITGLWQISGRSEITDFEEVVRLDREYIQNWSPELDFQILLKTVSVVLKHEGAE